jgi:hypothetical protein
MMAIIFPQPPFAGRQFNDSIKDWIADLNFAMTEQALADEKSAQPRRQLSAR